MVGRWLNVIKIQPQKLLQFYLIPTKRFINKKIRSAQLFENTARILKLEYNFIWPQLNRISWLVEVKKGQIKYKIFLMELIPIKFFSCPLKILESNLFTLPDSVVNFPDLAVLAKVFQFHKCKCQNMPKVDRSLLQIYQTNPTFYKIWKFLLVQVILINK